MPVIADMLTCHKGIRNLMKFKFVSTVVSRAVPVGNVSWTLFQKGRSSNFRL